MMSLLLRLILLCLLAQVSVLCLTADEIEAERSGWNVNPETQYHIQTDEGPERYFRFQTLNGQYRKEKRLQDGTVIGTEGWLDPLGYLRIKDYIADTKGYRILKSKMIFVGKDRPISEAVSISKKVPSNSGELARPLRPANPFRQAEIKDVSSNSIESNSVTPLPRSSYVLSSSSPAAQAAVPVSPTVPSLRLRPIVVTSLQPRPFSVADDGDNYLSAPAYRTYRGSQRLKPQAPALLVEPPYLEQDQNQLASQSSARVRVPAAASSAFRGYQRWNGSAAKEHEFPAYDGNQSSRNGFQYYLKKQYHEEERQSPDKSLGSFGYVDPFGIRRVVYYKADARGGFLHRKNNRYVGHEAKPYDPQPVAEQHKIH